MNDLLATLIILGVIGGSAYYFGTKHKRQRQEKLPYKKIPYEEVMAQAIATEQPVVKVPDDKVLVLPETPSVTESDLEELNAVMHFERVHTPEELTKIWEQERAKGRTSKKLHFKPQVQKRPEYHVPPYLTGNFNNNQASTKTGVEAFMEGRERLKQMAGNIQHNPSVKAATPVADAPFSQRIGEIVGGVTAGIASIPSKIGNAYSTAEAELARQGHNFRVGFSNAFSNV